MEEQQEITTKQLDIAVQELWDARRDYDAKKKISNEASEQVDKAELSLLDLLERANKKNYQLDGVAKVIAIQQFVVNTPKTFEDKEKFFAWLQTKLGHDGFIAYLNINHQSLQALWKEQFELAEDKVGFTMDGIGQPMERKTLRVNKL